MKRLLTSCALVLLTACHTPRGPGPLPTGAGLRPLDVELGPLRRANDPALLERVAASPIGYFRFINIPFANEVCRRFQSTLHGAHSVNLHGDAHVDQYAITETGRGLTDFDASSSGPAFIDWIRFGVSLHLTARQRGWEASADDLVSHFLHGYTHALERPGFEAPEPSIVGRVRSTFRFNPAVYFAWLDSVTEPVDAETEARVNASLAPYIQALSAQDPALGPTFFAPVRTARTRIGIGSALDQKYLIRIQGPTPDPDDDEVLELKEVRELSGVECLVRGPTLDPLRLLVAQARIAYEPYRLVGYVHLDHRYFWVHAWAKSYRELDARAFETVQELAEVAFDVGVQLGKGHPKHIATPMDAQLRRDVLTYVRDHASEIHETCRALADETVAAWTRAKASLDTSKPRP